MTTVHLVCRHRHDPGESEGSTNILAEDDDCVLFFQEVMADRWFRCIVSPTERIVEEDLVMATESGMPNTFSWKTATQCYELTELNMDMLKLAVTDIPTPLTLCPPALVADAFIKKPPVTCLVSNDIWRYAMGLFRYEIIMCEKLRLRPHPRIAEYYGVIAEAGKIVGLALKKYGRCLEDLNGSEPNCPSVDIICSDVQDGLDHLHRLGIAHNDIKPANICIDENNRAVIIDFDSAQRLGEPLGNKGGTPGWSRDSSLSTVENDAYSLAKVRQHLEFTFEGEIRTPAAML